MLILAFIPLDAPSSLCRTGISPSGGGTGFLFTDLGLSWPCPIDRGEVGPAPCPPSSIGSDPTVYVVALLDNPGRPGRWMVCTDDVDGDCLWPNDADPDAEMEADGRAGWGCRFRLPETGDPIVRWSTDGWRRLDLDPRSRLLRSLLLSLLDAEVDLGESGGGGPLLLRRDPNGFIQREKELSLPLPFDDAVDGCATSAGGS